MDFRALTDAAFKSGAEGTKEVPLRPGIEYVFSVARKQEELSKQTKKEIDGPSK